MADKVVQKCPGCGAVVTFGRQLSTGTLPTVTRCPMCDGVVHLSDDKVKRCPKCGEPESGPEAMACIRCGFRLREPRTVGREAVTQLPPRSSPVEEAPPQETRCPWCKSTIPGSAITCLECGRSLNTGVKLMARARLRDERYREGPALRDEYTITDFFSFRNVLILATILLFLVAAVALFKD